MKNRPKISLFSIFFTFFIDNLCWAIAFPIFAPYFLDINNPLFASDVSENKRAAILAIFFMAFSLGQFLGAPFIGEYADRKGRKKALFLSVLFTLIGLILTGWGIKNYLLSALFMGRLVTGFFSANSSICQACIADLSPNTHIKNKHFGLLSTTIGFSFVIGTFLGGKISDNSINSYFSPDLPIWVACGLTFINLLFILFGFQETKTSLSHKKIYFFEAFLNIKNALRTPNLKTTYLIYFFFIFSWTILFQFIPVVGVKRYGFSESNIGDLALFMGICWVIGSGSLNKILTTRFKKETVLKTLFLLLTVCYYFVTIPHHLYNVLLILGICVMIGGIIWPIYTTIISDLSHKNMGGKVLGMSQSVQSFAMTLAPLAASIAFQKSINFPFFIGSFISLIGTLIYWKHATRNHTINH